MDFISDYLEYTRETEPPVTYHRWCALTSVGALLSRSSYIPFGHTRIFPTLYTMLIGQPAARKSSAIKIAKKLVSGAGYEALAGDKTSKEKFLLDLEGIVQDEEGGKGNDARTYADSQTARNLWGEDDINDNSEPREMYIMADEFNEFAGAGNHEFYTTLGNLWDWDDPKQPYRSRLKNSRSVSIFQPTISIIGGNTQENFAKAFPPEIIGNGFLSRLLLIYGERSSRRYAFPPVPSAEATECILGQLSVLRKTINTPGELGVSPDAMALCVEIYSDWPSLDDARFDSYDNRRYTQLLKIAITIARCRGCSTIYIDHIIEANTILAHAEMNMPKALGEFGKSKNSEVANKIISLLEGTGRPLTINDIWALVMRDLEKIDHLQVILQGLNTAGKIQFIKAVGNIASGWLLKKEVKKSLKYVDFGKYLTEEERNMI